MTWTLSWLLCAVSHLRAQPMSGNYDIGGGSGNFSNIISSIAALESRGMSGPVTLNVYTGIYDGQVYINGPVLNLSPSQTLTIKNAPGHNPVVTNSSGIPGLTGSGFRLFEASYVTIEGIEIANYQYCGIYIHAMNDSNTHCVIKSNHIRANQGGGLYGLRLNRISRCEILGNEVEGNSYGIDVTYSGGNIIANNMLYSQESYGVKSYLNRDCEFYFNSVYMNNNASNGYVFANNRCVGNTVLNNIFYNAGAGQNQFAYYISGDVFTYPLVSDYNIIYAPDGRVGYYSYTGACVSLLQFQLATGLDAHSIGEDPRFVSLTPGSIDLHITDDSPAFGNGAPVADITVDFDGHPRYPAAPCIGCDEYLTDLRITLTPNFPPPLIIPPGGGYIYFRIEIENMTSEAVEFDIWTEVVPPQRPVISPLSLRRNVSIPAGGNIVRSILQVITSRAPPGYYTYVCNVGAFPGTVLHSDDFDFVKSYTGGEAGIDHNEQDIQGWFGDESSSSIQHSSFSIHNSYPNPFNASTVISFELRDASFIKLAVYDISGREVVVLIEGFYPAGIHENTFDGTELASGVYFAMLEAGGMKQVRKLLLVK